MSLRARLALLYTFTVGGILLLFGMAVYIGVSVTLTQQISTLLVRSAKIVIDSANISVVGELNLVELSELDLSTEVYVQVWGRNGQLINTSPNLSRGYKIPLDAAGLGSTAPLFHEVSIGNSRFRVLTVPLTISNSDRIIGYLQVGTSLEVVERTQDTLLIILLVGSVFAMAIAGLAGWISTSHALRPLETVTHTATQITRADDLSHRIPYQGPAEDEVGQLIRAFNQTLSRLENLFNAQRRFLADVGHELRTPLTVIRGNIDLMRRMDCTDEEAMESIENEVDRLTRLVGDLLLLAQAESGKLPLDYRMVELDTLLLDVLGQMQVLAEDQLELRLGDFDQVQVCGDQDRLKQVIFNLIGNAIKYTPNGGEVVVDLGKVENRAKLSVSDNGPGIPQEDLPYIFERFYRGEKSRTRSKDGKGFGLGLSIAYWIVRNHGGTIEVTSKEEEGTKFSVWLPLAENECMEG
jgi:signal transduction histidine kinase